MRRTVYFDRRLSISSLGLGLKAFVPAPNGLPLGVWERTEQTLTALAGDEDRLTIAQAATLIGVHKITVPNRIKNGSYRAELVQTERAPTWLIEV